MNWLKKMLPFAIGAGLVLLVSAGIYTWKEQAGQRKVAQDEKRYLQALAHMEKGELSQAEGLLFQLEQTSKSFRFLAGLQRLQCYQKDFALSGSAATEQKIRLQTAGLCAQLKGSPLKAFLPLSQAFSRPTPQKDLPTVSAWMMPQSPWYPFSATWNAFYAPTLEGKKKGRKALSGLAPYVTTSNELFFYLRNGAMEGNPS